MEKSILLLIVCVVATATPAMAADNGLYIGASIGGSSLDIKDFDDELGDLSFSDGDTAYKLFAGFRFLSFLAVEAGYVDLGDPMDIVGTVDDDPLRVQIGVKGWDAFAVGFLPLGPVDLFAKFGAVSWDADIQATIDHIGDGTSTTDAVSDSGTDAAWGLGVALRLGSIAIRIEGEQFDVDGADDLYLFSVGATFTF
jgi:OOP family OmpA-OmpF porin